MARRPIFCNIKAGALNLDPLVEAQQDYITKIEKEETNEVRFFLRQKPVATSLTQCPGQFNVFEEQGASTAVMCAKQRVAKQMCYLIFNGCMQCNARRRIYPHKRNVGLLALVR